MNGEKNINSGKSQDFKRVGKLTNLRNRFVLYVGLVGFWRNIVVIGVICLLFFMMNVIFGTKDEESSFVVNENSAQVLIPDSKTGAYLFEMDNEAKDEKYTQGNLIQNPSFEDALWQEKVGDCQNYDDDPILAMEHSDNASDGSKSLELQATRHIACTKQGDIDIEDVQTLLFKFDYQSDNANIAGYYVGFNDKNKTNVSEKIPIENGDWNTFEKQISVPEDATKVSVFVYSYPEGGSKENENSENIITRYDNFYLVSMPSIKDKYYYMGEFDSEIVNPRGIEVDNVSDTKKIIHVKGATTSFFLVADNIYNDGWKLHLENESGTVPDEYHFETRGYKNGWYVDVNELCGIGDDSGCVKNEDDSYDVELIMEYAKTDNSELSCCFWNKVIIYLLLITYIIWDVLDRQKRKKTAYKKRIKDFRRNLSK